MWAIRNCWPWNWPWRCGDIGLRAPINHSYRPQIPWVSLTSQATQFQEGIEERWALFFTRFNFTVSYILGSRYLKVDALSCIHHDTLQYHEPEIILPQNCIVNAIMWDFDQENNMPYHILEDCLADHTYRPPTNFTASSLLGHSPFLLQDALVHITPMIKRKYIGCPTCSVTSIDSSYHTPPAHRVKSHATSQLEN